MALIEVDRMENIVAAIVQEEVAPPPLPTPGWAPVLSLGLGVAIVGMMVGTIREITQKK